MPEKTSDLTEYFGPMRLRPAMLDGLRKLAEENERTVAAEIRVAIRKHLKGAK